MADEVLAVHISEEHQRWMKEKHPNLLAHSIELHKPTTTQLRETPEGGCRLQECICPVYVSDKAHREGTLYSRCRLFFVLARYASALTSLDLAGQRALAREGLQR